MDSFTALPLVPENLTFLSPPVYSPGLMQKTWLSFLIFATFMLFSYIPAPLQCNKASSLCASAIVRKKSPPDPNLAWRESLLSYFNRPHDSFPFWSSHCHCEHKSLESSNSLESACSINVSNVQDHFRKCSFLLQNGCQFCVYV